MDRTPTPRHLLSTLAAADLDAQFAALAKTVLDSADRAGLF